MKKKILVINGPNLNLLGEREKDKYGSTSLKEIEGQCLNFSKKNNLTLSFFQSNVEGEIINAIQESRKNMDGLIINAGGYTHTSVSIRDALKLFDELVIEIHMSNIHSREDFRHKSMISGVSSGIIIGFGDQSYYLAVNAAINKISGVKNYG